MIVPRVAPLGDSALTVTWPGGISPDTHRQVRWINSLLEGQPEVKDLVPSYTTLSVFYDPLRTDYQTISRLVDAMLKRVPGDPPAGAAREFTIPVAYDGADLAEVAERAGLHTDDVVARHSGRWYDVYLVGFTPGWAYLGELDASLALPRRASPRQRVPRGSVAIAGKQTGVYPFAVPGGWHLIGRTDTVMFDTSRGALLRVGDRVRFEPVR
ncbi:MAG TPA: 5-oxoprolinase subunit PxpB [Gemmatimonadales bacterium]|nr:5-oxoprolinase subunit PxpB [Gemmatimonadales bacterium]